MGTPTVLLVDDDQTIHRAVSSSMEGEPLQLEHAANGATALQFVAQGGCELVITDLVMPQKDGLSFVQTLRGHGYRMPIVVLSGFLTEDLQRELSRYQGLSLMAKPFRPQELRDLVRRLLGGKLC